MKCSSEFVSCSNKLKPEEEEEEVTETSDL